MFASKGFQVMLQEQLEIVVHNNRFSSTQILIRRYIVKVRFDTSPTKAKGRIKKNLVIADIKYRYKEENPSGN